MTLHYTDNTDPLSVQLVTTRCVTIPMGDNDDETEAEVEAVEIARRAQWDEIMRCFHPGGM